MRLSDRGAKLIADFEGFESCPYRDPVGVWTIGYGSTKGVGPNTPCVTRRQAMARLRREVNETYARAVDALPVELNQNRFDALTSFVYNVGPGGIAADTGIGRALRAKQWQRAADELLKWDKAGNPPRPLPGLTRRRIAERKLFLTRPAVRYSNEELRNFDKLKSKRATERRAARNWLERDAREIQRRARAEQDGWRKRDRGRRYQGIRRRLRA